MNGVERVLERAEATWVFPPTPPLEAAVLERVAAGPRRRSGSARWRPRSPRVVLVDPNSGAVKARGRIDVHGLASDGRFVWLADDTNGRLHRLALR